MGMDCYSRSGLGILVSVDDLLITKKEKCFDHNFPEDWKVDPITGKQLWKIMMYYNPNIFPEWKDSEYDGLYDASIGEYDILILDDDDEQVLICLDMAVTDSHRSGYGRNNPVYCKIDPEVFAERFQEFKSCMEEKKLWNDSFGLYTFLKISV